MSTVSDFDRLARAWLAEGPTQLNDRVLDAALREVHLTQRRAGRTSWRFPTMDRFVRATVLALVVVLGAAAIYVFSPRDNVGPGPSASAQATPTAVASQLPIPSFDATFTSTFNGYSVRYPSDWTGKGAAREWSADEELLWGSPALDDLHGTQVRFVGASRPLDEPALQDWLEQAAASAGTCVGDSPLPTTILVGGETGTVTLNGCPAAGGRITPAAVVYDVLVVSAGRGYDFTIDGIVDAGYVKALLATVSFLPLQPIPSFDATFVSPLNGFEVRYPSTWTATAASEPWVPGTTLKWGDPALDDLRGPDVRLVVASQPVPDGQTAGEWIAAMSAAAGGGNKLTLTACFGDSALPFPALVGSETGAVIMNGCPAAGGGISPGGLIYDVVVVVDGRGYDFTIDGNVDGRLAGAMLAQVTFVR